MNFHQFASVVNNQFNQMAKEHNLLYKVNISGDNLWDLYLDAFPEGTNKVYRERREYDCSTCRNFIKNIGNVVAIKDDQLVTVWDRFEDIDDSVYALVASVLKSLVRSAPVVDVFATRETSYGHEKNFEGDNIWHHFWAKIPQNHVKANVETFKGDARGQIQVFRRGLEELKEEATDTVLDLIADNNLYRGAEHKQVLLNFKALQAAFKQSTNQNLFIWKYFRSLGSQIRNTAIGTLLIDLSKEVDLETAVKSFEGKVSPTNYRRPKALVTPRMVEEAMKTVELLGIEKALHRRHARLEDLSVNDVIWVNTSAASLMKGDIKETLLKHAIKKATTGSIINIKEFLEEVVPTAKDMKVFFESPNNLVTITASDAEERLFSWGNKFAWSYNGDITDAIKDRVKAAGGNINAKLRVSLAWYNYDDLDIHLDTPDRQHIYFANKRGVLDVDMNMGSGTTRTPVENLAINDLKQGVYRVMVHNFSQREKKDFGFSIETEYEGVITQYHYKQEIKNGERILALEIAVDKNNVSFEPNPNFTAHGKSVLKWGISTQTWVDINTIMLSPNHWEDSTKHGNKHYFFIVKDCKATEPVRGIYNEFLRPELLQHKRTFELLGDKLKCDLSDNQVSGLGFSETQSNLVKIDVDGRIYNVQF
jgi:hypothetical protein